MPRLPRFDYEKFSAFFPKKTRWTLRPTRALLRALGFRQRFRAIQVVGTTGKGSAAAFLDSILRESGIGTGFYSSPHLARFNERIQVNGKQASNEEIAALWKRARPFVKKWNLREKKKRGEPLSEFEAGTALAFKFFEEKNCEAAVIEAGMGGRLDATNALAPKNKIAVITRISIDHAAQLGKTTREIAREKAAVVKRGCAAAIAVESDAASLSVVRARAKKEKVPLFVVGANSNRNADVKIKKVKATQNGTRFEVSGVLGSAKLETRLLGAHQAENAVLAWTAAKIIQRKDSRITGEAIRRGIETAEWPGRLEIVSKKPLVAFDGCHNPGGARALASALRALWPKRKWIIVFAAMRDKDYAGVLRELAPFASTIIATSVAGNERSASASEIARTARRFCKKVLVEEDAATALKKAEALAGKKGSVCVCGSLYLVGELKKRKQLAQQLV